LLLRALESCGEDAETFLLAAEIVTADPRQARLIERLQVLVKARLKERPEASIVAGKLALAARKNEAAETAHKEAPHKLGQARALPRLQAQAELGLAVVAYNKMEDDQTAQNQLKSAIVGDPTLYNAYAYFADLLRDTSPEEAFDYARKATTFNPDFVEGWVL